MNFVDDIVAVFVNRAFFLRRRMRQRDIIRSDGLASAGNDVNTQIIQIGEICAAGHTVCLADWQVQLIPTVFQVNAADIPRGFLLVRFSGAGQLNLTTGNQVGIANIEPQMQIAILIARGIQTGQGTRQNICTGSIGLIACNKSAADRCAGITHVNTAAGPCFQRLDLVDHKLIHGIDTRRLRRRRQTHADVICTQLIVPASQHEDAHIVNRREICAVADLVGFRNRKIQFVPAAFFGKGEDIPRGLLRIRHTGTGQLDLTADDTGEISDVEPQMQIAVLEGRHIQWLKGAAQYERVAVLDIGVQIAVAHRGISADKHGRGADPRAERFDFVKNELTGRIKMAFFNRFVVRNLNTVNAEAHILAAQSEYAHIVDILQVDLTADTVSGGKGKPDLNPAVFLCIQHQVP